MHRLSIILRVCRFLTLLLLIVLATFQVAQGQRFRYKPKTIGGRTPVKAEPAPPRNLKPPAQPKGPAKPTPTRTDATPQGRAIQDQIQDRNRRAIQAPKQTPKVPPSNTPSRAATSNAVSQSNAAVDQFQRVDTRSLYGQNLSKWGAARHNAQQNAATAVGSQRRAQGNSFKLQQKKITETRAQAKQQAQTARGNQQSAVAKARQKKQSLASKQATERRRLTDTESRKKREAIQRQQFNLGPGKGKSTKKSSQPQSKVTNGTRPPLRKKNTTPSVPQAPPRRPATTRPEARPSTPKRTKPQALPRKPQKKAKSQQPPTAGQSPKPRSRVQTNGNKGLPQKKKAGTANADRQRALDRKRTTERRQLAESHSRKKQSVRETQLARQSQTKSQLTKQRNEARQFQDKKLVERKQFQQKKVENQRFALRKRAHVTRNEDSSKNAKKKKQEEVLANRNQKGHGNEAYHYTSSDSANMIEREGLRLRTFATPSGNLKPLQAKLELALPPTRKAPNTRIRIDLEGLKKEGYRIPPISRITGMLRGPEDPKLYSKRFYQMPGGGYELQFPYKIPPRFLTIERIR